MTHFKILAVLAIGILLAGCPDNLAGITCPTEKNYSAAFKAQVAAEIDMIEAKAPGVMIMLNDYGVERKAIRKCLDIQKKARK